MQNILRSKIVIILILIGICIPVILPYFNAGYFPTHDGEWAVVRLADMFRTVRDLQIPPRFSGALNFGYGYPLFNFAYPFPYYLGLLLYIPTHSFVISVKTLFVLSAILSSLFMYLASNTLWKNKAGAILSSILYIYLPYRMLDLYVRGSIGESLALALFPLLFYLSVRLFDAPFSRVLVVCLSISISILVATHNIMTILFMPFLVSFIGMRIIKEKRPDVFQSFFLSIFLGAGISAFFWFPALFEKGNILLSKIPIADRNLYFVDLKSLFIPSWGYAPPTDSGGFSYQLGVGQVLVMLGTICLIVFGIVRKLIPVTQHRLFATSLTIIYLIYFVMMFGFTEIIWENVPLLSEINYPWTILSILGFISALLGGYLISQGRVLKYLSYSAAILAVFISVQYAKPEKTLDYPDSYYLTNEATTTSSSELMPIWVKEMPKSHYNQKVEVVAGSATIENLKFNSKSLSFSYKASDDPIFQINTIFYPGWKAYLNGDSTKINYDNPQGVMQIQGSKFRNNVSLYFTETMPRLISNIVSVVSILLVAFILIRPILLFKTQNE